MLGQIAPGQVVFTDRSTVLLGVAPPWTIPTVPGLVPKSEFHVTLIGSKLANGIAKRWSGYAKEMLAFEWGNLQWMPRNGFVKVTKQYPEGAPRTSVIKWGFVEGLEDAFIRISLWTGTRIVLPPTHVTVLTEVDNPNGIAINSLEEPGLSFTDL